MNGGVRAIVNCEWLQRALPQAVNSSKLRIIDATFHLPTAQRDAAREFEAKHIPSARFFDIDAVATPSQLPHMLPSAEQMSDELRRLAIGADTHVVVYDCSDYGVFSAPRLWWTLRCFGINKVSVLNGGLRRWSNLGLPTTDSASEPTPAPLDTTPCEVVMRPDLVRSLAQMQANVHQPAEQVLDARARGRFAGTAPEPRPGLPSGHIPGSACLPFDALVNRDGEMKNPAELRALFEEAGIQLDRPLVATCGSGVTACMLAFGRYLVDGTEIPVYDGAWTEWASSPREQCPIATDAK